MCGVTAIYAYHPSALPANPGELDRMMDYLLPRGPDGAGRWHSDDRRCAIGHRRLAIIDLDNRSAQPMVSGCGRYVLSFNGEIYNYRELRAGLLTRGCRLRTASDTEVLLELFARDGDACLPQLRGMFAFVLWDTADRIMWLARDPYGIKPLYYADDGWTVRAGSQVKALLAGGAVPRDVEPAGIVGFFLLGSVPEPFTGWQGVHAVPAGSLVRVDGRGAHMPRRFSSIASVAREAELAVVDGSEPPHDAFLSSTRHHLVADVPVGIFLSAGLDSGALLALVAECRGGSAEGVHAITLTYPEYRGTPDDESTLAAAVASTYGACHRISVVSEQGFLADLPRILAAMDQPTIDGVNTWLVSKAAREAGLKVALSGLGGDELLGGYESFRDVPLWQGTVGLPGRVPMLGSLARRVLDPVLRRAKMHPKLAGILELGGSWAGAYMLRRGLFMPWELPQFLDPDIVRDGLRRLGWREAFVALLRDGPRSAFGRVATLESCLYMRNQLLRDTDWASMAHSLEVRVPLVDVPLLRSVMSGMIARPGRGKALLTEGLAPPLPLGVINRRKTGFTTPVDRWLQRVVGGADRGTGFREPWARRWACFVGRSAFPGDVFRTRGPGPAAVEAAGVAG